MRTRVILLVLGLFLHSAFAAEVPRFKLQEGDRVVLLGDTFIEREQAYGYLETRLAMAFPGIRYVVRNLGWSADTVLGESRAGFDPPAAGFDRLREHLAAVKPTVVFLGYGMAASFDGEGKLPQFKADLNRLIETIETISKPDQVRFVILSPIRHECLPPPLPDPTAHNKQLNLYTEGLREIARTRGIPFVNLFENTSEKQLEKHPAYTDNGIHLTQYGYWQIARLIVRELGLEQDPWRIGILPDGKIREGTAGLAVTDIVRTTNSVTFQGMDICLPDPILPERVHLDAAPRASMLVQVQKLEAGRYVLKIDGEAAAVGEHGLWGRGYYFTNGPVFRQLEELRKAIVDKNELYFHRWRPQNQTYLFGFRKHEQGQNAREIPMFDPLINAKEEQIHSLKALRNRKYELVKIGANEEVQIVNPRGEKSFQPAARSFETKSEQPLPQFQLDSGLEVTLFAENPDLAKPIQMNFDPQGRLWVASSSVYPQIEPGQKANDTILVLEDTNHDGKADKSTVFADGLLIPTGLEPGNNGVYVGNSTELLHFEDLDGDLKADKKRVVLSGFGTEDTHHILHTLRWGHDGQLYFNQSIYIHSHIETPHGVVRLDSGGIFNLRPPTMELGIHMKGLINSWGHHFDSYGQSFATDGAGHQGINWVVPQAMYVTYEGVRRIMDSVSPGNYPKFCGLEVLESEHFPPDWQGNLITCDFRAHRIVRFSINELGTGYVTKEMPDVMRTTNVTFRPIDVKVGPDGALYIADWSNPIIQHGEVDFRDPRRDHEHGRIWRVSVKGKQGLPKINYTKSSTLELLDYLNSSNSYVRQQSRRVLTERGSSIESELRSWSQKESSERSQLQALWMYQSIDFPEPELLKKVLNAKDARIRAAGTRVLSFWIQRFPEALSSLERLVKDEHPRVRMEAVRALAKIPQSKSAELVLGVVDSTMDKYLEYAVWLAINDLADVWAKGVKNGEWKPEGKQKQLEYALKAIPGEVAGSVLSEILPSGDFPADGSGPWLELIAKTGNMDHLNRLWTQFRKNGFNSQTAPRVLSALNEAARARNHRARIEEKELKELLAAQGGVVQPALLQLIGAYKATSLAPQLLALAESEATPSDMRRALFNSLRELGTPETVQAFSRIASSDSKIELRGQAVQALTAMDLSRGVPLAITVLSETKTEAEALEMWRTLLGIKGAAAAFTQQLPRSGLPPAMAKAGLRAAREGGRAEPDLVMALARNLEAEEEKALTPHELEQLISQIKNTGDPVKGEKIYRRTELGCITCHAIGGIGGKVGPDMTSIGASAQIDYLIEAVQFPNRKIKEGYHAVLLETSDGEEISGIMIRETDTELVLRDATGRETSISKSKVQKRNITGSLMPAGLVDGLTPEEQVHLYRFLAELGKPGPFDASKGNVARQWKLLPETIDIAQFGAEKVVQQQMNEKGWETAMTLVSGDLPKTEMQASLDRKSYRNPAAIYLGTHFQVPQNGAVNLDLENIPADSPIWINGNMVGSGSKVTTTLAPGTHSLIVKIDSKKLPETIKARSDQVTFLNQ
ncbi:MAG: HEAT repeat domain-containing protein [Verrucomicrobiota bacterium]|nr:HEAT repeat domain-containing protein [Verrucomicrobiota bacterium]